MVRSFFALLMLPVGSGLVIALLYWWFSSIFRTLFHLILYFTDKFKFSIGWYCKFFGSRMLESNPNLVFTQLSPLIRVFSNNSTISVCVGSAIIALDKYQDCCRWTSWQKYISENYTDIFLSFPSLCFQIFCKVWFFLESCIYRLNPIVFSGVRSIKIR